jgi:hypothetical protein
LPHLGQFFYFKYPIALKLHYFSKEKIAKPLINKAIDDFLNLVEVVVRKRFPKPSKTT